MTDNTQKRINEINKQINEYVGNSFTGNVKIEIHFVKGGIADYYKIVERVRL